MVGNSTLIVLSSSPGIGQSVVHVCEDLLSGLGSPSCKATSTSSSVGNGDICIVDNTGGVELFEANIDVLIKVLVVDLSHTIGEQLIQGSANEVGLLHVDPHDPQCSTEGVCLKDSLIYRSLYDRKSVGSASLNRRISSAASYAIGDALSGYEVSPATANLDDDVTRIGEAVKRLPQKVVLLFQFGKKECAASCDASSIHCECPSISGARTGYNTRVEIACIYECHDLPPMR